MVAKRMCPVGNDIPLGEAGFADAQAPFRLGVQMADFWSASQVPMREAAAAVAQHVISRLVARHAFGARAPDDRYDAADAGPHGARVEQFVSALLGDDNRAAMAQFVALRSKGFSCEKLCHDVLAPAAKQLRALWREDGCDYAAFRLGLWRLRRLLHDVDHHGLCRRAAHRDPAAALFVTLCDKDTPFEHDLVVHSFARSGWHTIHHDGQTPLAAVAQAEPFHIAWISIDDTTKRQDIVACIRTIRGASRNRAIGILCGGLTSEALPAPWDVGADAVSADARTALAVAERWRMWQADSEFAVAAVA